MKPCCVKYVTGSLLTCTILLDSRLALAGPQFIPDIYLLIAGQKFTGYSNDGIAVCRLCYD